MSFAPSVTPGDIPPLVGNVHLIPWGCSIHSKFPSRGIDAKLLVTASSHILVNLADFAGMEEPDYDVWTSKPGRDSEETGTESDMTEGTEETFTDLRRFLQNVHGEEFQENRKFRERNHLQHTVS